MAKPLHSNPGCKRRSANRRQSCLWAHWSSWAGLRVHNVLEGQGIRTTELGSSRLGWLIPSACCMKEAPAADRIRCLRSGHPAERLLAQHFPAQRPMKPPLLLDVGLPIPPGTTHWQSPRSPGACTSGPIEDGPAPAEGGAGSHHQQQATTADDAGHQPCPGHVELPWPPSCPARS